jgi:putative tricarboxylic transport membrane protein
MLIGAAVKKETIIAGFWLVFSLYIAIESHRLGLSTGNRPGPGFFPFGAATAIGVIAGFRLVKNFRRDSTVKISESIGSGEVRLVLAVIAGMALYAYSLDVLGYILCTFLLVAFYLRVVADRSWRVTVSFAAAVALGSHLFFAELLNAGLPRGMLGWFE